MKQIVMNALWVVPIAAIAAIDAGAQPQGLIGPQAELVARYTDTDGDGSVSREEFVVQAARHLEQIIRMNADGYRIVDHHQLAADMVSYVESMFGDLNGDGRINYEDVLAQVANSGPANPGVPATLQGDANQDSVVDGRDLELLLDALDTDTGVSDAYAMALWRQILGSAAMVGHAPEIEEIFIPEAAAPGHRGPNDHNQMLTATWPPAPPMSPPAEWDWPADHLGTVSMSWPGCADAEVGPAPRGPEWPANHHGGVSATWGDRNESYWPPNHDISRSSAWNQDGMHQSLTSSTWPAGHTRLNSIAGDDDQLRHVAIVSSQNQDHDTETSARAGWPPNHIAEVSRTWDSNHDTNTSALWPANHTLIISDSWSGSWPDPNPSWPPNHWGAISATWHQPGNHATLLSVMTSPYNPFRIPLDLFEIPVDLISQLGFE